jgi:hypothetical protein
VTPDSPEQDKPPAPLPTPLTRDIATIVTACDIVASEMMYQVYRIDHHITPSTEQEGEHLAALRAVYAAGAEGVRKLQSYQRKRLERQRERGTLTQESFNQPGAIDPAGRAQAFTDDDEAPT